MDEDGRKHKFSNIFLAAECLGETRSDLNYKSYPKLLRRVQKFNRN
jgi:hypothetical protein